MFSDMTVFIHLYVILCVIQRVLLQTVMTAEEVSASVLNAVLATISLPQLCAAVSYFAALLYILDSIYNQSRHTLKVTLFSFLSAFCVLLCLSTLPFVIGLLVSKVVTFTCLIAFLSSVYVY